MSSSSSTTNALEQVMSVTEPVERFLSEALDQRDLPGNLREAARYSLLGPGKRMRPVLAIHSAQAVGGTLQQALPAAAALEMIHCFSLIHDDLPAMDDDDLRRGRPTLHKKTNDAMAILAGDFLNTFAFETIATHYPAELAHRLSMELATATNDMIAGQVYDTLPDEAEADQITPLQRLERIHHHKTGALIRGACRLGAIAAGADDAQLRALTDYAQAIGLMFQIVDDVLDVTQTTEQLGKTAGKDVAQEKLTYPALIGLEASQQQIQQLQQQAHQALGKLSNPESLAQLCDYLAQRTH